MRTVVILIPLDCGSLWLHAAAAVAAGSLPPLRSGGSGGRRIATWLNILRGSHTEFEKCSGLPGTGPWTFSAPACPGKYRSSDVIRVEPSSWNQGGSPRWVSSLRFGSVRRTCRVAESGLSVRRRRSNDGSPLPGALRGEIIHAVKGLGLYFQLVFQC